ncbi:hemerythrin [Trichlorobacter thiogenes]|uniref:Hemerythrin n=1 Tax=Trichlorobacter thiogenes TaxID=115783 RepID=A0A1T4R0S0_9BACT|nr:bacteriohemerythrin [Trichlorobacter thiogenes]SKA09590.1 hemerythrin [Trichlorobacter thiogenes]
MGLISCNKILTVGVQRFDDDHHQLVAIINQLHRAFKSGKGDQSVKHALKQLDEYTNYHFQAEEMLLKQHDYPHLEEHQQAHQHILSRFAHLQAEFHDSPAAMQQNLMQFLLDWLISHTKNVDQQYGPFLNSKGVY